MKDSEKKGLLFVALLVSFIFLFRFTPLSQFFARQGLILFFERIKSERWGPIFFILLYGLGCVLVVPGSVLTLAGGAIFGFERGWLYNLSGATLGASLAFWMARSLARDWVQQWIRGRKLEGIDRKLRGSGFQTVFRLRLFPLVPFNLLNFSAGLSSLKFRDYLSGTMLGMIPGCLVYTYFAEALVSGVKGSDRNASVKLFVSSLLLILLSFLPRVYKKISPSRPRQGD